MALGAPRAGNSRAICSHTRTTCGTAWRRRKRIVVVVRIRVGATCIPRSAWARLIRCIAVSIVVVVVRRAITGIAGVVETAALPWLARGRAVATVAASVVWEGVTGSIL